MPNWNEDSALLRANLAVVLEEIVRASQKRDPISLEAARRWQTLVMRGLEIPHGQLVGAFRGEPDMEKLQVRVGPNYGVAAANVAVELKRFEAKLQTLVAELDVLLPNGREPDADQLAAIVDLCAWVHAEWVRIHPFANGNGRTARLWANSLALRYGLPPFIRLRPRPNTGYEEAGARAMRGDWKPTAIVFHRLLSEFLSEV
jgi:Fic family protein